jgi:heptaprenyl diphosphate synthase
MMERHTKKKKNSRKNTYMSANRLTTLAMFIAVAMVFSYIESFIPVNIAIPGIKLGLANIVTIVVLQKMKLSDAIIVSGIRVILSALLFGNVTVMIYSLAGAVLSIFIMWIVGKFRFFTSTGISIAGAVGHNMGQLLVAALLIKNQNILMYSPALIISGTISGLAIGIVAAFIMKSVKL